MKFKNLSEDLEDLKFIYHGSFWKVPHGGEIELSDLNEELLQTAFVHPYLEPVGEKGKSQKEEFLKSIQPESPQERVVEETPFSVKFRNTTNKDVSIVSSGSRHTVSANSEVAVSGLNKELVAAALITEGLELCAAN